MMRSVSTSRPKVQARAGAGVMPLIGSPSFAPIWSGVAMWPATALAAATYGPAR